MLVEINEDSIRILDPENNNSEVVGWVSDEWKENPDVTLCIANALRIVYTQGLSYLKEMIKVGYLK